jgi:hypothetical protein
VCGEGKYFAAKDKESVPWFWKESSPFANNVGFVGLT